MAVDNPSVFGGGLAADGTNPFGGPGGQMGLQCGLLRHISRSRGRVTTSQHRFASSPLMRPIRRNHRLLWTAQINGSCDIQMTPGYLGGQLTRWRERVRPRGTFILLKHSDKWRKATETQPHQFGYGQK